LMSASEIVSKHPQHVYFYSLLVDGKTIEIRRMVVK